MSLSESVRSSDAGLFDYLAILWRHKGIVVLAVVVAVGAAVGIDQLRTPIYSSTSSIEFLSQSPSPQASGSSSLTSTQISTDVELVTGGAVRAEAYPDSQGARPAGCRCGRGHDISRRAHGPVPGRRVRRPRRQCVRVAPTPTLTKNDYLAGQNASEAALTRQINSLQGQIQTVSGQIASTPGSNPTSLSNLTGQLTALYSQQAQLKTELAQLQLAASQSANGANIVTLAKPSSSPSSPNFSATPESPLGQDCWQGSGSHSSGTSAMTGSGTDTIWRRPSAVSRRSA